MLSLWGNACDNVIKPIQTMQNRIIRNMYKFDRLENRVTMYKKVAADNIFPVRAMNFINTSSFIFQCRCNSIHTNFSLSSNRSARNKLELRSSTAKNSIGKKDILHFGINAYNSLPQQIKKSVHIHAFKFHLRHHVSSDEFLAKCFDGSYLRSYG